jgi:tRNA threonylcarbamoyladenosine biosynthesis protein TsaE
MTITLPDPQATIRLGQALAQAIATHGPQAILLFGPLGAGKTTLIRAMVEAMPGGQDAEVASPSFNLMNIYPTRPEVVHVDLYREPDGFLSDDLEEVLSNPQSVCAVEWAERLPCLPPEGVTISWITPSGPGRSVVLQAHGPKAERFAAAVLAAIHGAAT